MIQIDQHTISCAEDWDDWDDTKRINWQQNVKNTKTQKKVHVISPHVTTEQQTAQ